MIDELQTLDSVCSLGLIKSWDQGPGFIYLLSKIDSALNKILPEDCQQHWAFCRPKWIEIAIVVLFSIERKLGPCPKWKFILDAPFFLCPPSLPACLSPVNAAEMYYVVTAVCNQSPFFKVLSDF